MSPSERIDELLVQRVVEGLNTAEQNELDSLLAGASGTDTARFETAAAIVTLATLDSRGQIPKSLVASLLTRAMAALG
jgi:hypothetical protein